MLRRLTIAQRTSVLDLGAGYGDVTRELAGRAGGPAVALDRSARALRDAPSPAVVADAAALPFADATFDLVLSQMVLLYCSLGPTLAEVRRVLRPGGALLAIEPDFGGLVEHPPELAVRDVWISALRRSGADPCVGRKLPGALRRLGLTVSVEVAAPEPVPDPDRLALLRELPLNEAEASRVRAAETAAGRLPAGEAFAHLPVLFITAALTAG